jgi:hypothetical protein
MIPTQNKVKNLFLREKEIIFLINLFTAVDLVVQGVVNENTIFGDHGLIFI